MAHSAGSKYPLCSVIVINYNGKHLLERFLPSVLAMDYPNYEVVLVDNASHDGSAEFVKSKFPSVRIVLNPNNDGTAEGSNVGARHAKGDYILWLSNDMEVNTDFLTRLMEVAVSSPDIGICTCKMKRITETGNKLNEIDSVGGDIDIYGFPSARGINQPDKGQLDNVCEVFFSFGGAMLIKKSVVETVRGYDPSFFTLADDIDLSWRVRLAGYRVMVQPSAVLYHRASATLGRWTRAKRRFVSERNTLRTLLKNYSLGSLTTILPRYLGIIIVELIFFALRKPEVSVAYAKALGSNLLHLQDTLSKRMFIQATRKVSDESLKKHMIDGPLKINVLKEFMATKGGVALKRYLGE